MPPRQDIVKVFRGLSLQSTSTAAARSARIRRAPCPPAAILRRQYSDMKEPPQKPPNSAVPPPPSHPPSGAGKEVVPKEPKYPKVLEEMVKSVLLPEGYKFDPPTLPTPIPKSIHHRERYDPLVDQFAKEIMRDGKLSQAQRHMAMVLNFLRTSPPPRSSKPLVPGAPPPAQLPLDPLEYLRVAVDSVAPLIKVRSLKGMAGGGAALDVPVPLNLRQRRRVAIKWILNIVSKKESRVSGRERLSHRLAAELIAIVQGHSPVWDKRLQVHKQGTTARANLNSPALRKKGMQKTRF